MQTITKAGQVFSLFSVEQPEWGDASQALKYLKSSTTSPSKRVRALLLAQGALRKGYGLLSWNV